MLEKKGIGSFSVRESYYAVSWLAKRSFTFYMEGVITQLVRLKRIRTAESYRSALNSFNSFCDGKEVALKELNTSVIEAYEGWLRTRGIAMNTVSFYMRILRAVYNRAVERGWVANRKPFRRVYTGVDKTVKRAISSECLRRIGQLELKGSLDLARDLFLFSFYTRGMSFVDMAYLRKTNLKRERLVYRRHKTDRLISIHWEPCMQRIVDKYRLMTAKTPYLLPVLRDEDPHSAYRCYRKSLRVFNNRLKWISAHLDLDHPLTTYVARHSWASVAYANHVPVSVISEGMGHDSEKTTRIYLASLEDTVIDRANADILKVVL